MDNVLYDIAIIGAGPAGMTAAIYAGRAGKKVVIFDKDGFGGQIAKSPKVENIPGFLEISGADFAEKMYEQMMSLPSVNHTMEEVKLLQYKHGMIFCGLKDGSFVCTRSLIIAVGSKPRELKLGTKNIYYCVTCDGPFFKGQDVIVVGSGNTGVAFALELATYCHHVYVCDITMKPMCEAIAADKLDKAKNITFLPNCTIASVKNDTDGNLESAITSIGNTIQAKAIFGAAGMIPQTKSISSSFARKDPQGYFISNDCETGLVPGIFVAGDCRQKAIRQVTTAVSDGTTAAIKAMNFLNGRK
jgi:thioredoxin reductase (NADPH)